MKISWQNPDIIKNIVKFLQKDEVLVTTTDTIPGLLANITEQSFEKLNKIKGGRQDKPYLILISGLHKLTQFVDKQTLSPELYKILVACWPGPLTAIFKASMDLPDYLKSPQNTVALRCPKHIELLKLLENFDGLFSTSANKSGQPSPKNIADLESSILSQVVCIVDSQEISPQSLPSTILDFSRYDLENKIYLVRDGAYSLEELRQIYGPKIVK